MSHAHFHVLSTRLYYDQKAARITSNPLRQMCECVCVCERVYLYPCICVCVCLFVFAARKPASVANVRPCNQLSPRSSSLVLLSLSLCLSLPLSVCLCASGSVVYGVNLFNIMNSAAALQQQPVPAGCGST